MTPARDLARDPRLEEDWYYSIELAPGVVTPGRDWPNLALTRLALGAADVRERRCLDIGTQEGVVPTLLARRGAGRVVAQDSRDRSPRIDLVRSALGVDFDYLGGVRLDALRTATRALGAYPFEVVVFGGVLYHLHDPIAGLARARGLLANGGLMIVETITAIDRRWLCTSTPRASRSASPAATS
jgi:2-polyprenyl-3-methyl-5-hydroxy-6-metoxy-1,4-benzoquinol methylase